MVSETSQIQRGTRVPGFSVAMRGYDREQVQRYVSAVHASAEEALQRLQQAEEQLAAAEQQLAAKDRELAHRKAQPGPRTAEPGEAGDRIAQLLRLASEEADAIRMRADQEASQVVAEAQHRGEGIIKSAEGHAARVREAVDHLSEEKAQAAERRVAAEVEARMAHDVEEARHQAAAVVSESQERHRALEGQAVALRREAAELAERRASLAAVVKGLEDQRRESVAALAQVRQTLEHVLGASGVGTKAEPDGRVIDLTTKEAAEVGRNVGVRSQQVHEGAATA